MQNIWTSCEMGTTVHNSRYKPSSTKTFTNFTANFPYWFAWRFDRCRCCKTNADKTSRYRGPFSNHGSWKPVSSSIALLLHGKQNVQIASALFLWYSNSITELFISLFHIIVLFVSEQKRLFINLVFRTAERIRLAGFAEFYQNSSQKCIITLKLLRFETETLL
jgi:type IV secretory pathway VirB3-like protein